MKDALFGPWRAENCFLKGAREIGRAEQLENGHLNLTCNTSNEQQ